MRSIFLHPANWAFYRKCMAFTDAATAIMKPATPKTTPVNKVAGALLLNATATRSKQHTRQTHNTTDSQNGAFETVFMLFISLS
ncbi:hypothetical protein C7N43_11065 [Sphingobacteriales bacterium UPWRP_1]|nr:hypothetical protein B6N25_12795 [Sphingobacteriales bacterium TSM_CSS]PSJ76968.1 hypothetical protein C7N43_11065 [Sphingobacteriales bacterium UPWRP_1]